MARRVIAMSESTKKTIRMALSWSLGLLGADRFYNGNIGWGIIKLLTFGGLMVWWIIDAIYFTMKASDTQKRF
jgi:TM2 domain-containing membrane protein YozV